MHNQDSGILGQGSTFFVREYLTGYVQSLAVSYPLLNYSVVGGKVCNPELYLGATVTDCGNTLEIQNTCLGEVERIHIAVFLKVER